MRDIYDFNHIDQTLSKEKVKKMKDLYVYYHKKHFGYEKLYRGFRRKNFVCNLSAGKFIVSAAVAGGITLNPVVIATLTGVGLILKAVASLKKYDKKTEQANFARIEYQKVLDEIPTEIFKFSRLFISRIPLRRLALSLVDRYNSAVRDATVGMG